MGYNHHGLRFPKVPTERHPYARSHTGRALGAQMRQNRVKSARPTTVAAAAVAVGAAAAVGAEVAAALEAAAAAAGGSGSRRSGSSSSGSSISSSSSGSGCSSSRSSSDSSSSSSSSSSSTSSRVAVVATVVVAAAAVAVTIAVAVVAAAAATAVAVAATGWAQRIAQNRPVGADQFGNIAPSAGIPLGDYARPVYNPGLSSVRPPTVVANNFEIKQGTLSNAAGGPLMKKTSEEIVIILDELSEDANQWPSEVAERRRTTGVLQVDANT
uniref:Cell wall integrity and stress response component 1-like n=1 Tax=Nicotiana tabacum TaxID=4097 RepID=A0A1S3Z7Y7_TOBAC|nr:PREDICTED: cell wall integrity and stress response component 1-like [Nicotiana tabacum]